MYHIGLVCTLKFSALQIHQLFPSLKNYLWKIVTRIQLYAANFAVLQIRKPITGDSEMKIHLRIK